MNLNSGRLLKKAANQLSRNFDKFAQQYDLTSMQMSIIDFVGRNKQQPVTQRDIEHEFNIQRSTATTMLQRMEKKQLVTRKTLVNDARQKQVELLPRAVELRQIAAQYMLRQNERLKIKFSHDEIETFQRFLTYYINDREEQ